MPLTHTFVSPKSDTPDATKVQASHWNAPHNIDIFVDDEIPTGDINATNDTFILSFAPNPESSLQLFVNGFLLRRNINYTLSGNIITLKPTDRLNVGDDLRAFYRKA